MHEDVEQQLKRKSGQPGLRYFFTLMEDQMKKEPKKSMLYAILSLSLLTVMAGAAVAPALGKLMEHFASSCPPSLRHW